MTFILKQIFSFFQLLNSDTGENQIAAGIAVGLILGFAPTFSLQTIFVILVLFFFRIQVGAATLAAFFFKFIAWMLDPVSNVIGKEVLETASLRPLFTEMYNMPLIPLTRFSNSIVMGSFLVSIVLAIPVFFIAKLITIKYRIHFVARIKGTKIWKAMAGTKFYQWYSKYNDLYGSVR